MLHRALRGGRCSVPRGALCLFASSLLSTSAAAAEPTPDDRPEPPRVVVTAMAGAGLEWVLSGLAEVRVVHRLYLGAGYRAVAYIPHFGYHGPSLRFAYRAPLGDVAAITPRVGADVMAVRGRGGVGYGRRLTGHFPVVPVLGVMASLHPGPVVLGVEAGLSWALVYETGCASCGEGVERNLDDPDSVVVAGVHAGLVLGLAL